MKNLFILLVLIFIASCSTSEQNREKDLQVINNNYNLLFDSSLSQDLQKKEAESLLKLFNKYEEKYSKNLNLDFYIQKAQTSIIALNYKDALLSYDSALKIATQPETIVVYYYKGMVYNKLKDYENVLLNYNKALDVYNNIKLDNKETLITLKVSIADNYILMGKNKEALEIYKNLYNEDKSDEFLVKIIDTLSYLADYNEQIKYLNILIKKYPNNSNFYAVRGSAYVFLKNYPKAIENYNKAILIDNRNLDNFVNRSFLHIKTKNYLAAIKDADFAILKNNLTVGAYINKMDALIKLGKYSEAINVGVKAIEIKYSNNNDVLHDTLIKAYLYNNDLSNAFKILQTKLQESYKEIYKDDLDEINTLLAKFKNADTTLLNNFSVNLKLLVVRK